jgi:quercetin dioxygenase-like cupin family protein
VIVMETEAHVVRTSDVQPFELEGASLRLLDGAEHGFGDVSIIISEYPPNPTGSDVKHRHPHISTIVITEGRGRFMIGDDTFEAATGEVVVVPANAWHNFVNIGDGVLRVVGVADSGRHALELPADITLPEDSALAHYTERSDA